MNFVKLVYDNNDYRYDNSSDIGMSVLGRFFTVEIRDDGSSYKNWALHDPLLSACGNMTSLDKDDGYIFLSDLYSEENVPTEIKLTTKQFVRLIDDWEMKVWKEKPKSALIKHEDGEFVIETSD